MDGFVKTKVLTNDGQTIGVMYETWNRPLYDIEDFNPSKRFLDNVKSGEELLMAMRKWFIDSTDERMDEDTFSDSEVMLKELKRENMKQLEISSCLNWEDRVYGSEIAYDFETKKRVRKNTGRY